MPDYRPIIRDAYREILGRAADAGGLASYNRRMNEGLSESELREALLRSDEYADKNPFSVLAPRVGMNVHVPSNAMLEDVARNIGLRWIRVDFDWFRIEPQQGTFRFRDIDRIVNASERLGLKILATLAYTPPWASSRPGNPQRSDPPASVAFWTDFVRAAVRRYRGRITFWQFWNEPNLDLFWTGTMQQYRTRILVPGARAATEEAPGVRTVAPGLANVGDWRDGFEEVMRSKSVIDVINHHNYPSNGHDAIGELQQDELFRPSLRTLMREHDVDDRPFWLTETGRKTSDGNQPQYVRDVLASLEEELWVHRLFFFHYWDGPGQGNGGFGFVNENFSPKPVYHVLKNELQRGNRLRRSST